jgi:hypothetical protein
VTPCAVVAHGAWAARSCWDVEEAHLRQNASGGSTGSTTSGGRLGAYKNAPDCVSSYPNTQGFSPSEGTAQWWGFSTQGGARRGLTRRRAAQSCRGYSLHAVLAGGPRARRGQGGSGGRSSGRSWRCVCECVCGHPHRYGSNRSPALCWATTGSHTVWQAARVTA